MDVRLSRTPAPKTKVTPKTVVISRLLELPSSDLRAVILQELSENPALELVEASYCERCGAVLSGPTCPDCGTRGPGPEGAEAFPDLARDDTPFWDTWREEDDWDPLSRVAAPWSLRDHLLWQLCPQLSAPEMEIAAVLLESLDDHGLLGCELETICSALDVSLSQVTDVLSLIQRQDPAGIGARTVQESLLIQLESSPEEGLKELSRKLIEEHWEALGRGRLEAIAKEVGAHLEDVERARDFIRTNLDPYPAHAYLDHSASGGEPVDAQYLQPDVVIVRRETPAGDDLDIHFPDEGRYRLFVRKTYRELLTSLRSDGTHSSEYEHVREFVDRSKLFISSWAERWDTLRRVVEALVDQQKEFLLDGAQALRPLTRAHLADTVGVHESTVSRAVASKYVELPGGHIVALADFFDGSLKAKAMIHELVSQESHPLTDGELAGLLAEAGINVARRTVAKYRQALGILPSELR
jgi:RNA polymerase sigma-54 factor